MMINEKAKIFGSVITQLISKQDISRERAKEMFYQILRNEQSDLQQGAFLAALTSKGETAAEIAGCWEAIYELDTVKVTPVVSEPLVDNCGTGMDALKTFNISTAASVIAAAAGIRMAKHGARAITSMCGTIDILEMLGVDVECDPDIVTKSIEKAGIGIFNGMSPKVHPQALGRILSQINFGTVLNISASLANPALPVYGVRGVYSENLTEPVAKVMREIGYKKALVVHGFSEDGLQGMDEASTLGRTVIAELKESGEIIKYSFLPEDLGIERAEIHLLSPSPNKQEEALRLIAVLSGQESGARSDIVCLNAGLVLYLMDVSISIQEGFQKAKEIIATGKAIGKLKDWVREQNTDLDKGFGKFNELVSKSLK